MHFYKAVGSVVARYTTWQMTHVFNVRPTFSIMYKLQQEASLRMFLLSHSCDTELVRTELCLQWGKGFGLGKKNIWIVLFSVL